MILGAMTHLPSDGVAGQQIPQRHEPDIGIKQVEGLLAVSAGDTGDQPFGGTARSKTFVG